MRPGYPTRILPILPLLAAWGCGAEPNGPGPAAVANPRPDATAVVAEAPPEPPPSLRAPAVATGDPELDPLVSYLKATFAEELRAGKVLVVDDRTDVQMLHPGTSYGEFAQSLLEEASPAVPTEVIRDFAEKNRKTHPVWPELTRLLAGRSIGLDERAALFSEDADTNWQQFYEAYPDAAGLITVSRVGLSPDRKRALFYLGQLRGALDGHGQLHVLEKQGDEWIERRVRIGTSWES